MNKHGDDVIDLRDLCERFEELEEMKEEDEDRNEVSTRNEDEEAEFVKLGAFLKSLKGYGGDHQWRGDWYPVMLIRDDYFETYAQEFAEDIGAISRDAEWPYTHIDWEAAAEALQQNYSSKDWDGVTYWYC